MLQQNEKKLLYVLAVIVILCGAGLFFFLRYTGGLEPANVQIRSLEKEIQNISNETVDPKDIKKQLDEIATILDKERNKVYKPGEIDISSFGIRIKALLARYGLREQSLRTLRGTDGTSLQFQFSGNAYDFSSFLKEIATNDKYWKIEDLLIKSAKRYATVDVTMRITYETAAPENR